MKKYLDRGLIVLGIVLVLGALAGSAYFLFSAPKTNPVQTTIEYEGVTYKCLHYSNGEMECSNVDDENIGFGRDQ